ncbi:MAG: hypothetical protein EOO43_22080 [Flavobacterium sp.]|nr:MAG: hypothetical protein EOO43_22080 [Flavobacterium sp.]
MKQIISKFASMPTPNPREQEAINKLGQNVRKYRILMGFTMVKVPEEWVGYTTITRALKIKPSQLF